MPRYAIAVEYDGHEYLGWQAQKLGPTLQATLEAALSHVANTPITVVCSGRTDAGVHGLGQIVHFDSPIARDERAWTLGGNSNLPKSMAIRWCQQVDPEFHARYSALARVYRYSLINRPARAALFRRTVAWEQRKLDLSAMQQAAAMLVGEHDFTSFRTVACQAKRPWRRLDTLDVSADGEHFHFLVQANAFLHHMVRNLVGSLLVVGRGEQPPEWIEGVLKGLDRTLAGATAPAEGLVFLGPKYPARFGLPADWVAARELELWIPPHMRAAAVADETLDGDDGEHE
jgi:tRNA pseudouridine38-40 synthase